LDNKQIGALLATATTFALGIFAYSSLNTQFNLILPDGTERDNVILSYNNFSQLKQNVGIFTVYHPTQTTSNATIGYCPLAKLIHEHEDGYNNMNVGSSNIFNYTIPPAWCDPELNPVKVPEFGSMAALILIISIISIIAISKKK